MKITEFKIKLTILLLLFSASAIANNQQAGVMGYVYKITEPDMRERLAKEGAEIDWQKTSDQVVSSTEDFLNEAPGWVMPTVNTDRKWLVDLTFEIEEDLKRMVANEKGQLEWETVIPAGSSVNPLEVQKPNWLFIFDGLSDEQNYLALEFSEKIKKDGLQIDEVIFILSAGSVLQAEALLQRPVYFLPEILLQQTQLKHTPAIVGVTQKDKSQLTVAEFSIPFHLEKITEIMND